MLREDRGWLQRLAWLSNRFSPTATSATGIGGDIRHDELVLALIDLDLADPNRKRHTPMSWEVGYATIGRLIAHQSRHGRVLEVSNGKSRPKRYALVNRHLCPTCESLEEAAKLIGFLQGTTPLQGHAIGLQSGARMWYQFHPAEGETTYPVTDSTSQSQLAGTHEEKFSFSKRRESERILKDVQRFAGTDKKGTASFALLSDILDEVLGRHSGIVLAHSHTKSRSP
jgi:hypothetical protein